MAGAPKRALLPAPFRRQRRRRRQQQRGAALLGWPARWLLLLERQLLLKGQLRFCDRPASRIGRVTRAALFDEELALRRLQHLPLLVQLAAHHLRLEELADAQAAVGVGVRPEEGGLALERRRWRPRPLAQVRVSGLGLGLG